MNKNFPLIQAIRGMHDVLPEQTARWFEIEQIMREVLNNYAYQEIRLPIVEKTELFERAIGEVTDIVEKEMYTFIDRNGDSLTLRPEGTAGCLRACLEHSLLNNQIQRLWYYGSMFRHERPQKGRYRQFYQLGVELYGLSEAESDAEIIALSARLWKRLGILPQLTLQLNSLGTIEERLKYKQKLVSYLTEHFEILDQDSQRRLQTNPLRILDSKNPQMQSLIANAPSLFDELGEISRKHFEQLLTYLNQLQISYQLNPRLVRGLDYYSHTVFEWVTDALGAQNTVCAGGRYDGLIQQLGGKSNHAIGFALGMERVFALMEIHQTLPEIPNVDVYLIRVGELAQSYGLTIAEKLRDDLPKIKVQLHYGGGQFKTQFKKADKSGAKFALIVGEDEVKQQQITIKYLRESYPQQSLSYAEIIALLKNK